MDIDNNRVIKYQSYLTQQKLGVILHQLEQFGEIHCLETEKKIEGTRYSWDFTFMYDSIYYVVEFDGEAHYRDIQTIRNDHIKEEILFRTYSKDTAKIIRVPFWIQLDNETFLHLFKFNLFKIDIIRHYKHGFIASKHFPASFCHLGYQRFLNEACFMPSMVRNEIYQSLQVAVKKYGDKKWVFDDHDKCYLRLAI